MMPSIKIFVRCLFCFTLLLASTSCSRKTAVYGARVNFLYKEAAGTIVVRSVGIGNNVDQAKRSAIKHAFNVLFFKGLPGTELSVPLVSNEMESRRQHPDFYRSFFDQRNYDSYIMSIDVKSGFVKVGTEKSMEFDLKINYKSLRIALEQSNIIRKFGL